MLVDTDCERLYGKVLDAVEASGRREIRTEAIVLLRDMQVPNNETFGDVASILSRNRIISCIRQANVVWFLCCQSLFKSHSAMLQHQDLISAGSERARAQGAVWRGSTCRLDTAKSINIRYPYADVTCVELAVRQVEIDMHLFCWGCQ